jgi:sulfotransferase family protein
MDKTIVLIVGLRRSGTTAIWRAFHSDNRMKCFNEPFNPQIMNLSNENFLYGEFYQEYADCIRKNGAKFWASYAPIENIYELRTGLSEQQKDYLSYLAEGNQYVVFEMTRAHYKLADLRNLFPNAILIHLYRPAASFVSSVMLPNYSRTKMSNEWDLVQRYRFLRSKLAKTLRKITFWSSKHSRNMWGFDSLIGSSVTDAFSSFLNRHQIDGDEFYRLPAVARLLGYWKVSFEEADTNGRRLFGDRFISLNFNDFCNDPEGVLKNIYATAGITYPNMDIEWIQKPHNAYQSSHKKWREYADILGLDRALL